MTESIHPELILRAQAALNPVRAGDVLIGDVGAALVTPSGNVYTGVCVGTPSWGLCAERSAMATMITAGEYRIRAVVAVWQEWEDEKTQMPLDTRGALYVLPPCGHCRQFMMQVDPGNRDTQVVLSDEESLPLRQLLPRSDWPSRPVAGPM
jgi:cytidine deaminase